MGSKTLDLMFSPAFRAAAGGFREQTTAEGRPEGVADVMVAVFDVPDTAPAVGNTTRQIIDDGAFRSWLETMDWAVQTVPFLRDHGNAHMFGYVDSSLILGFGTGFREGEAKVRGEARRGLVYEAHWNLLTTEGRDAFERARFDPYGTQYSFRWGGDDVYRSKDDGFEHVRSFLDVVEVSQVGFAAQADAGLVDDTFRAGLRATIEREVIRLSARGPIASHSTETDTGTWDGPANEARLDSGDGSAAALRKAHAWVDSGGDAEAKASYKFVHHFVGSDGSVGAASTRACSSSIGILNGGRGGTTIPDGDRQGVYDHVARHLRDAGLEVPDLRAAGDPGEALEQAVTLYPEAGVLAAIVDALRHKEHGDKIRPKPTKGEFLEWLKDAGFAEKVAAWIDSRGASLAARAFSVEGFAERVYMAVSSLQPEGGFCWCAEVFVEDSSLMRGWVVVGMIGSYVVSDGTDGEARAIGGEAYEPGWYRISWEGSTPDVDGVPTEFVFDPATAVEVERAWVPSDTPTRAAGWVPSFTVLDPEAIEPLSAREGGEVDEAWELEYFRSLFGRSLG